MIDNCTALIGYKTYPHIDMYEVATRIGGVFFDHMAGKVDAVMRWGNTPVLAQTLRMGHVDEPMKSLIARARQAEDDGEVLAATVFGGFPLADIHDAGLSSVVVTDGDGGKAEAVCREILALGWAEREEFVYRGEPLADAVGRAKTLEGSDTDDPVILLDHADNTGSGGTQDTMAVVAEVLRQGLEDVAVGAIWDPEAAKQMQAAGVGAEITVDLGGKTDMPSIDLKGEPLRVTGRVRTLTDGEWVVRGPMYTGVTVNLGPTAVFEVGKVQIVVISLHHEPWDQGIFTSVGIDPQSKKYLLIKSRVHYRAGFAPIARETITCDGVGVTTSDNDLLDFKNVRRPIYPLDLINEP
jgi:microcystin degradation protein MlrC